MLKVEAREGKLAITGWDNDVGRVSLDHSLHHGKGNRLAVPTVFMPSSTRTLKKECAWQDKELDWDTVSLDI